LFEQGQVFEQEQVEAEPAACRGVRPARALAGGIRSVIVGFEQSLGLLEFLGQSLPGRGEAEEMLLDGIIARVGRKLKAFHRVLAAFPRVARHFRLLWFCFL
jgi:hypothetical protein